MTTADRLIAIAEAELGVTEFPPGSNNVKYNTAYYGREVYDGLWDTVFPWCCVFVWWCFREAGAPELFYGGGRTANCGTYMDYHALRGQLVTADYRPGDIVLFNWSGEADNPQHMGIVKSFSGRTVRSIEGNTSLASNDNGGSVMLRDRDLSVVIGAIRPAYDEEEIVECCPDCRDITSIAGTGDAHSAWADEAINALTAAGIFGGDGNGNYGWYKAMTREAVAKVLYETLKKVGLADRLNEG